LTTAALPNDGTLAQAHSQKQCRDDVWGVWDEDVLTSDWPYTQDETRGEVWGAMLTNAGTWAGLGTNCGGPVVN